MPTDKAKVTSYLGDEEKAVFDKLCKEKGFSNSEGVAHLIREQLIEKKQDSDTALQIRLLHDRIDTLALKGDMANQNKIDFVNEVERQDELIAELQRSLESLQSQIDSSIPDYLLDEEIASVTGCREQQVYEWRMGLRKPRGERILHKLEPYEIKDGRWVKKRMCEG